MGRDAKSSAPLSGVRNIGGKGYGDRTSVLVMRCLANLTTAKLPLPMVRSMS